MNFKKYDQENPKIWESFKKFSFEAKEKGFKNYSANGIFEVIRWHTELDSIGFYKVDNNYRADYARKMMNEFREFEGFFRVRELKSERI